MNTIKKVFLPLVGFILLTIIGVGLSGWSPLNGDTEKMVMKNLPLLILGGVGLASIASLGYFLIQRTNLSQTANSTAKKQSQQKDQTDSPKTSSNLSPSKESIDFQRIFDQIGDAICVIDRSFTVVKVNRAWLKKFNLTQEEALGEKCYKVLYKRDELCQDCPAMDAFRSKKVTRLEKDMITVDGEIEYFDVQSIPILNKEGSVIQVINHARDTTEQVKKEEQMQKKNIQLKAIIETIPDVIYFKDLKGDNLVANNAYDELIAEEKTEEIDEEETNERSAISNLVEQWKEIDEQVIEEGKVRRIEDKVTDEEGNDRFFDTIKVPFYDKHSKIAGVVGISRDITERKKENVRKLEKAKETNFREAAKFSSLLSDINESVLFADDNDQVVEVNNRFAQFMGIERPNLLGKDLFSLYSTNGTADYLRETLNNFHKEPDSMSADIKHSSPNGEVALRMQPIYNDSRYEGVLVIVDEPVMDQFGAIEEGSNGNEKEQKQSLYEMPNEILVPIKIETEKLGIEVMDFNIQSSIDDMAKSLIQHVCREKSDLALNIRLNSPEAKLNPRSNNDASKVMHQVVLDIVGNAIKFTKKGKANIRMDVLQKEEDTKRLSG